jgi:5-methyltetrahydrofolate--homocysteine methyltransferase
MSDFLKAVQERVVIYDGATGTNLQKRNLTVDDFWGKEGCNEILVLSRPDVIRDLHASFYSIGSDVVETDTFGSTRIVLAEYGLEDKVRELNLAAARLARDVASQFATRDKPRFVAGSIGPTTKLPSLGHIKFDDMVEAYVEQAVALIEGGVDLLLVETCQDILQAKAGIVAAFEAMQKAGKRLPVTVQITLEATGSMLLGTEIGAALTTLEAFDVDIIGMNCATGPAEMNDAVRYLSDNSSKYISVLPNAGLPQNEGGHAVYKLSPEEFGQHHKRFVLDYGVRVIGGCCGTSPEHIKAAVDACANLTPKPRNVKPTAAAASTYSSVPLDLDPKPLVVAEEMNTTTRKAEFRDLVRGGKFDDVLVLAKRLVNEGSHVLDLCTAVVGEDDPLENQAL